MKLFQFTIALLLILSAKNSLSQCTTTSQTDNTGSYDYSVTVYINPIDVVPSSPNCSGGYNFDIEVNYSIVISGSNPPAGGLYTMQAYMECDNGTAYFNLPNSGGNGSTTTGGNIYRPQGDCNTATPSSLGCDLFSVQIHGPELNNTFIDCAPGSALNIQLETSKLLLVKNKAYYSWSTLTEKNSSYFIVERSSNGKDWAVINRLDAQGTSETKTDYSIEDKMYESGIYYYKLREVDLDGDTTLLDLKSLEYLKRERLNIFPNPSTGKFTIENYNQKIENLELLNAMGAVIPKNRYSIHKKNSGLDLDLTALPKGVYYLNINTENKLRLVII